jgi:hypothetical protein
MYKLNDYGILTSFFVGIFFILMACNTINRIVIVCFVCCICAGFAQYGSYEALRNDHATQLSRTRVDLMDTILLFFGILCSMSIFLSIGIIIRSEKTVVYTSTSRDANIACSVLGLGSIESVTYSKNSVCTVDAMMRFILKAEYELYNIPDVPVLMGYTEMIRGDGELTSRRVITCKDAGVMCYRPYVKIQSEINNHPEHMLPLTLIRKITIFNARQVFVVQNAQSIFKKPRSSRMHTFNVPVNDSIFLQISSTMSTFSKTEMSLDILEDAFLLVVYDTKQPTVTVSLRQNCKSTTKQCPENTRFYKNTFDIIENVASIRETQSELGRFLLYVFNVFFPVCIICFVDAHCNIQKKRNVKTILIFSLLVMSLNYIVLLSIIYKSYSRQLTYKKLRIFIKIIYLSLVISLFFDGSARHVIFCFVIPTFNFRGVFYNFNLIVNFTLTLYAIWEDIGCGLFKFY